MKSDLTRLEKMFENMEEDKFDTKNYLKWGFYFFDANKESLIKLKIELMSQGYKYENLVLMEDNMWRLFITCIDVLTPEKLHAKNIAFNQLASLHNVSLYDGWEVEKI